jgi:hypothetical protein
VTGRLGRLPRKPRVDDMRLVPRVGSRWRGTNSWLMRSGKTERVRVVAIGGSASVGKTTCAERVAELLGVSEVIHVDDLSKRIQDNGEPHPLETIDQPWRRPPTYLAQQLIEWTPRLHPAILEAVEQAASTGGVIEGEGIDPRLAPELASAGVAAVYVIETGPDPPSWDLPDPAVKITVHRPDIRRTGRRHRDEPPIRTLAARERRRGRPAVGALASVDNAARPNLHGRQLSTPSWR